MLIIIMFKNSQSLILLFLVIAVRGNIWDNMYSQTYASTPIIIEQSLNLDFTIPQYSLTGSFDFNSELSLATVTIYFNMIVTEIQVFKAELDLSTLTLSAIQAGKSGCQKYQLQALANAQINPATINKSGMFLINLVFKYVGKSNIKGEELDKYKFEPFLFGNSTEPFEKAKKEIEKNIDEEMEDPLDDFDPEQIEFLLYVMVDPKTGTIKRIAQGKQQKNVPFKLSSKVKRPMNCQGEVKVLTSSDLRQIGKFIADNRGNYDKFIPDGGFP